MRATLVFYNMYNNKLLEIEGRKYPEGVIAYENKHIIYRSYKGQKVPLRSKIIYIGEL